MVQQPLQDSFGRRFSYLRLSVTDACNFKCVYCLPNGYKKPDHEQGPLSIHEIKNLVTTFAEMGTIKIRLTGGEPTLRNDFLDIVSTVAAVPGIQQVAVSTNGFRLKQLAKPFRENGVTAINVSIDTLDQKKFSEITGSNQLPAILEGIEAALAAGFPEVKINAVLMNGLNEDSLANFLAWIKDKPVAVRFIELMPTGQNKEFFANRHVQSKALIDDLTSGGWNVKQRGSVDGPAQEYTHPDYVGRMGIIAPYAKDFCSTCNRLRVTSQGGLRMCLFGEGNHPLRDLLQDSSQKEDLKLRLISLLQKKEISHYLPEGRYGNNNTFSSMGG
ncbi:MAG: GTP 3',8-cyclase MoaA [Bdellovibrio sp.]|nr:GTP 3',8-cyclase MoaA [Bdellovibrio sp.]